MASLAIDPLNLIRVMPAEGRYEARLLPCFPFLEARRKNGPIPRADSAKLTSTFGITSHPETVSD
jgi:hypothetical protein